MFLRLVHVLLVVAFVASGWASSAEAARWIRITQHQIDPQAQEDLIDLRKARGSFIGFRLRARRGAVAVDSYVLNFHDKTKHEGGQPFRLRSGERTRIIARDEGERFPESLSVRYQQDRPSGRYTRIEVWGLQSRQGRRAQRPEKLMAVPPPPGRVVQPVAEPSSNDTVLIAAQEIEREVKSGALDVADKLGKFKRLRLAVRDGDVQLETLTVRFDDGSKKDFTVEEPLLQNSSTPWFEIDPSKFIEKVSLSFREPTNLTSPTRIELYGTHSDGWLASDGEGKSFNDGWILLGAQTAGFIGFDNDVIPLADHGDGFAKIRVNVRGRAITLNQLRVIYVNGEEDIIPVRSRIDAGDTYGPITLRGAPAQVREIRARYRSRVIDKVIDTRGPALVQVWAKR